MATLEYVGSDVEYFQLFLLPHSACTFQSDDIFGNARPENSILFLNHTGNLLLSMISLV